MSDEIQLPAIPEEITRRKSIMPFLRQYLREYMSQESTKDITTRAHDAAALREKFHTLYEELDLAYYVELVALPKGNYALIMSEYPLTADQYEPGTEMPAELQGHEYQQHTFVADATVKDAMWGVFNPIASFVYYELPPRWRRTLPNWQPRRRVCPILFVAASDGQCEMAEREFRRTRLMPDVRAALEAVKAYQVSMLPELLDDVQMLTEQVDRAEKKERRYKKEQEYDQKQELEYMLSKRERGAKVSNDRGWNMSLISSRAMRYVIYALALCMVIVIIWYVGSAIVAWITAGGGGGGGTTTTTPGVFP